MLGRGVLLICGINMGIIYDNNINIMMDFHNGNLYIAIIIRLMRVENKW